MSAPTAAAAIFLAFVGMVALSGQSDTGAGIGIIVLLVAILLVVRDVRGGGASKGRKAMIQSLDPVACFVAGVSVAGVEGLAAGVVTECIVTDDAFLFSGVDEMDANAARSRRIPRNAVRKVSVDVSSQITQRLTATRFMILGAFALAAPKKEKNDRYWLAIEYVLDTGMQAAAVFEFGILQNANVACSAFQKYAKAPAASGPTRVEVPCPWCAEPILAAARVCKHCGRDVSPSLPASA